MSRESEIKTYVVQGLINSWGQPGHLIGMDATSEKEAIKKAKDFLKRYGATNFNNKKEVQVHES